MLPPTLNEWLPECHQASLINDVVEKLDLSAFYARYEGNDLPLSLRDKFADESDIGSLTGVLGALGHRHAVATLSSWILRVRYWAQR